MKLLNVLAVFAFIAMAKGAVNKCKSCLDDNLSDCKTNEVISNCSDAGFPSVGTTNCYTAVAYYMKDGQMKSGIARGCGNCSANNNALTEAALALFNQSFNTRESAVLDVSSVKIECCDNADNCNNQTVSLPSRSMSTTSTVGPSGGTGGTMKPSSHATRLFPISGIVAFVAIFLALTL